MSASRLQYVQDLWLLDYFWSVHWQYKLPQLLEACKVGVVHQVKGCGEVRNGNTKYICQFQNQEQ